MFSHLCLLNGNSTHQTSPAHTHCQRALTLTHIYSGSDFGAKIKTRFLFMHLFRALMRSSPTSFVDLPGQCTSATARNLCAPPCYVLRWHTHTHTRWAHNTQSCCCRCCWARVKEFCARVVLVPRASPSARVTHIPQNSRTNSLLCYVHVLRATHDQLIEHMYRQRPERNRIVYGNWNGTEGHSPRTYPFLTVCPAHVCVCVPTDEHSFWSAFFYVTLLLMYILRFPLLFGTHMASLQSAFSAKFKYLQCQKLVNTFVNLQFKFAIAFWMPM